MEVQQQEQTQPHVSGALHPEWGKRGRQGGRSGMLPRGSRILWVGSKYLTRLALVLACQDATATTTATTTTTANAQIPILATSRDGMVSRWTFANGDDDTATAELWVVVDTYAVWGGPQHWQRLLEEQLTAAAADFGGATTIRLSDFDAVAVSLVQECSHTDTTKYTARMQAWQVRYNDSVVDCLHHAAPAVVPDWTSAYDGPLVLVSLPNKDKAYLAQAQAWRMQQYHRHHSHRTLGVVSARRWMDRLATSDCHDCVTGAGTSRRPCVGTQGGWTDVVVWDLMDFFHAALVPVEQQATKEESNDTRLPASTTSTFTTTTKQGRWYPVGAPETTQPDKTTCRLTSNNDNDSPDSLWPTPRFCQDRYIAAAPDILATPVQVTYWCEGPHYNAFGDQLRQYMVNHRGNTTTTTDNKAPELTWGRRKFPFPANKRILVIGNSHTRQTLYSLLCQHQTLLQAQTEIYYHGPVRYEFCHNSTVVTLFNSHVPYSHQWKELLEAEVQEPLENFNAVMLGLMNHCGGSNGFSMDMERLTADIENVDCIHISPPSVSEWAKAYDGPIVFVSMFSTNQQTEVEEARQQVEMIRRNNNRTNVVFVDARQHVVALHNECASYNRSGVMDCVVHVRDETDIYNSTHRCVGAQGGHPDLVAWDAVEQLHALLI